MKRYYITDRRNLAGTQTLLACIARNFAAGVNMVQIREKDLCGAELAALVRDAMKLKVRSGQQILVNERMDVAIACGADGVHLTSDAVPAGRIRQYAPAGFIIGVSTHTEEEAVTAEMEGADFVVFGPVFAPLSKTNALEPRGLFGLRSVCSKVRIPVFALGGITRENAVECERAGAAGVAGITLFQSGDQAG